MREENVAAVTAQPLAALPPCGCGVPLAGSDRHAGWQYLRYAFCGVKLSSLSFRGAKRRGNLAGSGPITGKPRRKRNCLPEIAPQGHFLALRAQGATSAFGLLAMTIRGPLPFYRQPVRIVSAAPGAACRSPTTHDWQFCVTFHFPFCIFHLHHASPLRFALHSITKNCRTRVGAAAERISYLLRAR